MRTPNTDTSARPATRTKKILCIAGAVLLAVILIALCVVTLILPVTYAYDNSLAVHNPAYNVVCGTNEYGVTTLQKINGDGLADPSDFKILVFTDAHLDHREEKGDVTFNMIVRNIAAEQPDLVVFTGDIITSSFNRRRAKQLAQAMEDLGVYWALCLGNHEHDNPWSMTRQGMLKLFAKYGHCLIDTSTKKTAAGESVWGYGNYYLHLLGADGSISQTLYFLDTGADMSAEDMELYADEITDPGHNDYDYIKESQIAWYRESVAKVNECEGRTVKSVLFTHIPLTEYKTAYDEITGETEATQNVPTNYGQPNENGTELLLGQRRETICFGGHNSGTFNAILNVGSTQLVVAGHDHINDFAVTYRGVTLAYCQPSGYSSYNVVTKGYADKLTQGYSVLTVANDGTYTWEARINADLWPELQEDILKLYQ